ncbi:MAG TPA: metalloregulator ArsR/SmtB family transcription factor [Limnochordia bacterium]|nr:metalloregulator ArsR/SmtB family transcription factor [Limnochordia bacterium]
MQQLVRAFKALGDESRLRIVRALNRRSYCVCELADAVGLTQPTLSHHLKILREIGLVSGEKDGQLTHCSLNERMFLDLGIDLGRLIECCESSAEPGVIRRG